MELINRFIQYTIKSIENMFAPRCKCNRNKPKRISDKEWIAGYKESMSKCLKSKRIAMREINPDSVVFTCKKVTAETEIYQGRKRIIKIIE